MHKEDMRSATDVGMNSHGENEVVELAVVVVEMILAKRI